MSDPSLPEFLADVAKAVATAPEFANYRELAARARLTRKSQIVRTVESRVGPFVDRLYPVSYEPAAAPRSHRYRHDCEIAERFLHYSICTEADWTSVPELLWHDGFTGARSGRRKWGKNYRGSIYQGHAIAECEGPSWCHLEKRRGELLDEFAAAAGRLPELARFQPWRGCVLIREWGRQNRRGQPSLKSAFYRLAAEYAEAAPWPNGKLPRGFWPAIARHLSFPEFGIKLTAAELRKDFSRRSGPAVAESSRRLKLSDGSQSQR